MNFISCSDCQDLLSEYIDNELIEVKQVAIRRHLRVCKKCNLIYLIVNRIVTESSKLFTTTPAIERELEELTGHLRYCSLVRFRSISQAEPGNQSASSP
jgi:predicted anti-sigma-YlaC factor YlaD